MSAVVAASTIQTPTRMLLAGDSMAGSLAIALKKQLPGTLIINRHRHSTGLTVKSYHDWPANLAGLVEEERPDFILFMAGANDAQGIIHEGKVIAWKEAAWEEAYRARSRALREAFEQSGKPWLVVGMPKMRDGGFDKKMQRINAINASVHGERFVSMEGLMEDEQGRYRQELIANDGIHFSMDGTHRAAQRILEAARWKN